MSNIMSNESLEYLKKWTPQQCCKSNSKDTIKIVLKECEEHLKALDEVWAEIKEKGEENILTDYIEMTKEQYKYVESWVIYLRNYMEVEHGEHN
ncbi:hypothetical protein [Clostridium sp.]|uniref:hypothetical protein n=1 Tax=Clostridium sp. TaxID=1506 RepID=UPI0032177F62